MLDVQLISQETKRSKTSSFSGRFFDHISDGFGRQFWVLFEVLFDTFSLQFAELATLSSFAGPLMRNDCFLKSL